MKVTEEGHLHLWPAGGAAVQLHRPHVASWLLLLWVSAPLSIFILSEFFSIIGQIFPSLSSFSLSSLHQLLSVGCAPGVDLGTAPVGPIELVGSLFGRLEWRSSGNLMKMQVPGALGWLMG